MARVLGRERTNNGRVREWIKHTDDYGQERLTVKTHGNAAPVFDYVAAQRGKRTTDTLGKYRGSIDITMVENLAAIKAKVWGTTVLDAFKEIMSGSTDRGKAEMNILLGDIDYRKFQNR